MTGLGAWDALDGPAHEPMLCGECICGERLVEAVEGEVCPVEYHERVQALRAEREQDRCPNQQVTGTLPARSSNDRV